MKTRFSEVGWSLWPASTPCRVCDPQRVGPGSQHFRWIRGTAQSSPEGGSKSCLRIDGGIQESPISTGTEPLMERVHSMRAKEA